MQEIVFIVHILSIVALIALVLVQHGKGADMGAAFGSGASNTMFGSVGSISFFAKLTAVIAIIFFATSITLGIMVAKQVKQVPESSLGIPEQVLQQAIKKGDKEAQGVNSTKGATKDSEVIKEVKATKELKEAKATKELK